MAPEISPSLLAAYEQLADCARDIVESLDPLDEGALADLERALGDVDAASGARRERDG